MKMNTRRIAWPAAVTAMFLAPGLAFAACTPVTTAPTVITASGQYCLTSDLLLSDARGTAIDIEADNVTLDLQGYEIRGPHYGGVVTIAESIAVRASDRRNITIRNGRISGFGAGVVLQSNSSLLTYGHLIEKLHIDGNAGQGIALSVGGTVVRDNRITRLNGYLQAGVASMAVKGIYASNVWGSESGNQIINNSITQFNGKPGNPSGGIVLDRSPGTLVEGNYIQAAPNTSDATTFWAVKVWSSPNVTILNNRIQHVYNGIAYIPGGYGAPGKYSGNITEDVQIPYSGGTPVGSNF